MSDRRLVGLSLAVISTVALFGLITRVQIMQSGLARPDASNIYFRLYALHEAPFMLLLLLMAVVTAIALVRRPSDAAGATTWADALRAPLPSHVAALAIGVFAVALASWYRVHHELLFSMDEFAADFQARIFANGDWRAALEPAWRPFVSAMTPIFTVYQPQAGSWLTLYLPGYALLKVPFLAAGLVMLLNPLLAAGAVAAMAAVARRLWPDEGLRPWLAIAFLVTSSQFVVTSGTGYSMPAHLCLNLVWLWLYLRDDARSWAGAIAVGVVAFALHQPFPHALFIAPILIRMLRRGQWARLGAAAVCYGAAAAALLSWMWFSNPVSAAQGGPGLSTVFNWPNSLVGWLHLTHLSLVLSWQTPLLGALLVVTIGRLRRLPPVFADLALGLLLTLAFYLLFPTTQGHGWGYRYVYPVLGSVAILAAAAAPSLIEATGARRARWLLATSFVLAVAVQVPLRLFQAERLVRPFAAGERYIRSRPARVVLVHGDSIWYGRDLVRNDPYLRGRPIVVSAGLLTPARRLELERANPGQVLEVRDGELLRLGMTRWASHRR